MCGQDLWLSSRQVPSALMPLPQSSLEVPGMNVTAFSVSGNWPPAQRVLSGNAEENGGGGGHP